jgi:(p)ppGpp synthase/HD superfamily hydrolase
MTDKTMFLYKDFIETIAFAHEAHFKNPRVASKRTRRWDGETPYTVHPLWCAMTILSEVTLPSSLRINGAHALMFHDIIEDAELSLPAGTPEIVKHWVQEMTFESTPDEMTNVWTRSKESRLLKLYDKVSNIMDGNYMSAENRKKYMEYTTLLLKDVEKEFGGELNIVKIAKSFVE